MPPVVVNKFFNYITKKKLANLDRVFEQLKTELEKNEWNRGYFQALNGMALSKKSGDSHPTFISNMVFIKSELQKHRREFLKNAKNELYTEYDRGFFTAWADYLSFLLKKKTD